MIDPHDEHNVHREYCVYCREEKLRAEIERLRIEAIEWKKQAGKYSAGCELCEPREAETERLKAELEAQRDSQISAVNGMLRAEQEIERLKAELHDWQLAASVEASERRSAHAEIERLRAAHSKQTIQGAIFDALGCVKFDYRSPQKLDEAAGIIADFVLKAICPRCGSRDTETEIMRLRGEIEGWKELVADYERKALEDRK